VADIILALPSVADRDENKSMAVSDLTIEEREMLAKLCGMFGSDHPGDIVKASLSALKAKTGKLGAPTIEGKDPVAGKDAPALYFGSTKMNNTIDVVDEVVKENGGAATLFVKAGEEYVRVATTVKKDDGSSAMGTILNTNSPAVAMINKGQAYYGEATIFGKPYVTGYEPIKDASGKVIGISASILSDT
jgi:Cache 3/Cache 2 fusion domain